MTFIKGHPGHWKGKKFSKAHRRNIRNAKVGVYFTDKHKRNIGKALKEFWRRVKDGK